MYSTVQKKCKIIRRILAAKMNAISLLTKFRQIFIILVATKCCFALQNSPLRNFMRNFAVYENSFETSSEITFVRIFARQIMCTGYFAYYILHFNASSQTSCIDAKYIINSPALVVTVQERCHAKTREDDLREAFSHTWVSSDEMFLKYSIAEVFFKRTLSDWSFRVT